MQACCWDTNGKSSVKMTARFSMGFKDIFRRGSNYLEYKMLHMRGTVAVSYAFLRYNDKPFRK